VAVVVLAAPWPNQAEAGYFAGRTEVYAAVAAAGESDQRANTTPLNSLLDAFAWAEVRPPTGGALAEAVGNSWVIGGPPGGVFSGTGAYRVEYQVVRLDGGHVGGIDTRGGTFLEFSMDADSVFHARGGMTGSVFGGHLSYSAQVRRGPGQQFVNFGWGSSSDATTAADSFAITAGYEYRVQLSTDINFGGALYTGAEEVEAVWNWSFGAPLGATPQAPILPVAVANRTFVIPVGGTSPTAFTYVDPTPAIGYDYASTDQNFTSVLIPDPLPGGDGTFELLVAGRSFSLIAGTEFDFTTIAAGGVGSFSIRGIDPGEHLDPTNPAAFVTGLKFAGAGSTTVLMTPVTTAAAIPEPAGVVLVGLGAAGLLGARVRRRAATG
jgi:hypothetical protein